MEESVEPQLVSLAKERFGKRLRTAEIQVAWMAWAGNLADFGHDDPASGGEDWPFERAITARFLCWLLASADARPHLHHRGVNVVGARVEGPVQLKGAEVGVRVSLHLCALEKLMLEDASIRTLSLSGSCCAGVDAKRLHVRGGLFLDPDATGRRFSASGTVDLTAAKIEGAFRCSGAQIVMTRGRDYDGALDLSGAEVHVSVRLDDRFSARGKVVLRGARIGGSLMCSGGAFYAERGSALEADAMEVAHSVRLDDGFTAQGQVDLTDVVIGHNLRCLGGSFEHEVVALSASRLKLKGDAKFGGRRGAVVGKILLADAEIGGSVELKDTSAAPRVELPRAKVGTNLTVEDVWFAAVGRPGLIATDATVGGALEWSEVIPARSTQLDLRGADVRTLADGLEKWPENIDFEPRYEGLTYRRIEPPPRSRPEVSRRVKWLRTATSKPWGRDERRFNPQPYNELAKALRAGGEESLSVEVAVAREDERCKHGGLGRSGRAWSRLLGQVIGHGYRPYRALKWSLVFVLVGTVIFWWADKRGYFVPTTSKEGPSFFAPAYSLDAFLPVTDLQQERFRSPGGSGFWAAVVRLYFWLHIMLGWVLVTLGLLGVTGLVRRE